MATELKSGAKVRIDGKVCEIETIWNQGKHRMFKLTDGRQLCDLHKRENLDVIALDSSPTGDQPRTPPTLEELTTPDKIPHPEGKYIPGGVVVDLDPAVLKAAVLPTPPGQKDESPRWGKKKRKQKEEPEKED